MSQSFESFGKYILLEKIQTGGMAEIYLARKPGASGVSKFVAIKRILPQFSEQNEFIEMFKDEAKIAVNLSHANIVSIHEFGVEKAQFFIAMDYVEGRNLRQILNKMKKSNVSFSIEQVLFIIKEVAGGLDHAHRCIDANTGKPLNIIHRDMSPQNVMVSFEGEVKIVDFGIAKAETQLDNTRAGTLKGKFGYMSPEQAEGLTVDLRTDIFALGIVLWELLANDRLFVANNEVNTLRKVRDCQIPSLRKINPNIPPELERIVSKALAKDRNLRYQTGAAFQRELSRFLNRQYPDFSPHDFSVFIKTLFAAEILENRKKMVEFAKFEAKPKLPPALPAPGAAADEGEPAGYTKSLTMTENTFGDAPFADSAKEAEAAAHRAKQQKALQPPPRREGAKPSPHSDSLNTSALSVDRTSYREREGLSQLRDTSSSYYSRSFPDMVTKKSRFSAAALMPVALIAVGVVAGTLAFMPGNLRVLMANLTGATGQQTNASTNGTINPANDPSPSQPTFKVRIISNPSGAEIKINDEPVRDTTPTVVLVPQNKEAKISIRKPGHAPLEQMVMIDGNKEINVTLNPELIGHLDINVVGSGQIFVDGKAVAPGSPANHVPVHADQDVVIRAEDPVTRASDEVRVRVAPNAVKKITLIPRAFIKKQDGTQKQ